MKIELTDRLAELHRFILESFVASGHSPTLADVQHRFGLSDEESAENMLAELEATRAIHRASGDPLATHAYPFSNEPTPHRVQLASGVQVYAMCAVDALGIPFMLNTDARIESGCSHCGQSITVAVQDGALAEHAPESLLVGYMPLDCCTTPATEQCPNINFFCSPEHLDEWMENHRGEELKTLSLSQALERGREIFGAMMQKIG